MESRIIADREGLLGVKLGEIVSVGSCNSNSEFLFREDALVTHFSISDCLTDIRTARRYGGNIVENYYDAATGEQGLDPWFMLCGEREVYKFVKGKGKILVFDYNGLDKKLKERGM